MRAVSVNEAFEISRKIRDIFNQYEGLRGCDAVLLCFAGDVDGQKMAHIKVNNPPDLPDTAAALVQYAAMHAYTLGYEDREKELSKIEPSKL